MYPLVIQHHHGTWPIYRCVYLSLCLLFSSQTVPNCQRCSNYIPIMYTHMHIYIYMHIIHIIYTYPFSSMMFSLKHHVGRYIKLMLFGFVLIHMALLNSWILVIMFHMKWLAMKVYIFRPIDYHLKMGTF